MSLNRKISGREARRQLADQADAVAVAIQNDGVVWDRLNALDAGLEYLASVLGRGFWGRVSWLLRGK